MSQFTSATDHATMNTVDRFSSTTSSANNSARNSSTASRVDSCKTSLSMHSPPDSPNPAEDHFHFSGEYENESQCGGSQSDVDFIDVSDEPPTQEELDEAGNIPIYDENGGSRLFHTLFRGPDHQGQRQLIVFIRHFYCSVCQSYLKALTQTITPSVYFSLQIPTTITIVGCGDPRLLSAYKSRINCPFRMYVEPTRRLYKFFKFVKTMRFGRKPKYCEENVARIVTKSTAQMVKSGRRDVFLGGNFFVQGGEVLFEDEEPIWIHRMKYVRGHSDMDVLKRILDIPEQVQEAPWPPERRSSSKPPPTRSGERSTHGAGVDKPKGLRLVYDEQGGGSGGNRAGLEVPRARLARDSRDMLVS